MTVKDSGQADGLREVGGDDNRSGTISPLMDPDVDLD